MADLEMDTEFAETFHKNVFPLVYRMVGSVAETEDLLQEGLLRYQTAVDQGVSITNPHGFLVSVTTRLAIDHLKSARVRREVYPGEWLPEPVVTQTSGSSPERIEIAESVHMAFMILLETLSPLERAVFLLRQVFDYDYPEIADVVGKSEANCRQVFSRARKHISENRPRFETSKSKRDDLAKQFFTTCQNGDLPALEKLLAEDVAFHGDGGGVAAAVQKPVIGSNAVAKLVHGIFKRASDFDLTFSSVDVNGEPGMLVKDPAGAIVSVLSLHIHGNRIVALHSVINPDKLQHLGVVSSLARLSEKSSSSKPN